jgi:hypothetical protein
MVKAKKAKDTSKKNASINVSFLSSTKNTGSDMTRNERGKLIRPVCSLNVTALLSTASSGITRSIRIAEPPIKLPTDISGVLSTSEKNATEISLNDVSTPRAKNDTRNEDIFTFFEIFSTEVIEIPAPVHNVIKEISIRERSIIIY